MNMFLADRFSAHRILTLGVAGTLIASASLVTASPVRAVVPTNSRASKAPAALRLDYQTGNFAQWREQQLHRAAQQAIVTTPAHTRYTHTARFVVAPGDYTNGGTTAERSEVMASVGQTGNPAQGQTMWFAWSTFIPAGTQVDSNATSPVGNGWLIFTQWHGSSSGGNPDIAFGLSKGTTAPHLIISTQGGAGKSTAHEWFQPKPIPLGVWNDFVVGVVWGQSPATGRLTVKMNGTTLIANAPCSNLFTGLSAYLKQGIYQSASKRTHTIYHTATRRGLTEASVAR
jgi:Polysaccharide lyase